MTKSYEMDQEETEEGQEFPIPAVKRPKLSGWDFYHKTLGAPKLVVAPMVDASECAWRLLGRRHGAQLCYSPMWHSTCFVNDVKYRQNALQSCQEDRPLIIQFCGNDPQMLLDACLIAQDHCDAIDLNLGCPQSIASRGHYGAYLQDEWELLEKIVSTLHRGLSVPITCKIRVFESVEKTIQYAQMLEKAGAQLLTVHGRTREQKGANTGLANWEYIKAVRENVTVPVFANGNIQSLEDVHRCIEATGVVGVMSAEGHLYNPALFDGVNPVSWDVAHEYLDLVEEYPAPNGYVRGHLFKIFHHLLLLKENLGLRMDLANANNFEEFRAVVQKLESKYLKYHNGEEMWVPEEEPTTYDMKLPPWICQPYVRPPYSVTLQKLADAQKRSEAEKREYFDEDGNQISRKKLKKLEKKQRRKAGKVTQEKPSLVCSNEKCGNLMGTKCDVNQLCRACCKERCGLEGLDCPGHKIFIKTHRENRAAKVEILSKDA